MLEQSYQHLKYIGHGVSLLRLEVAHLFEDGKSLSVCSEPNIKRQ